LSALFIRGWQELSDQVRRMIIGDPRYREIQALMMNKTFADTGEGVEFHD
jgi:hypothetical protein